MIKYIQHNGALYPISRIVFEDKETSYIFKVFSIADNFSLVCTFKDVTADKYAYIQYVIAQISEFLGQPDKESITSQELKRLIGERQGVEASSVELKATSNAQVTLLATSDYYFYGYLQSTESAITSIILFDKTLDFKTQSEDESTSYELAHADARYATVLELDEESFNPFLRTSRQTLHDWYLHESTLGTYLANMIREHLSAGLNVIDMLSLMCGYAATLGYIPPVLKEVRK